ncbi:MAG: glycosyl hydrolase family 28-related protein [Rhodococcus sp. (in: high G+C Gram-positive bacteria)]
MLIIYTVFITQAILEPSRHIDSNEVHPKQDSTSDQQSGLNVVDFGADNTGRSDATPAILDTISAALTANNLGGPTASVFIPSGLYRLDTPLDLSKAQPSGNFPTHIDGFQIVSAANATFYMGFSNGPAINIEPPPGHEFRSSTFQLGNVYDDSFHENATGVQIRSTSNSSISILGIRGFSKSCFSAAPTSNVGVFNNTVDIRMIRDCNIGFQVDGNSLPNLYGFQGNEVHLGQVSSNNAGIVNGSFPADSTQWNSYTIGAVEDNAGWGIIDNSGQTEWHIINENSNSSGSMLLAPGAVGRPIIEGHIEGRIDLSGGAATRLVNANQPPN